MTEILFIRIPKNASTSMHECFSNINIINKNKHEGNQ